MNSNIIAQYQAQRQKAKRAKGRKKFLKKGKKLCLTPVECDELIKPLIVYRKHMIAMNKADKEFWEAESATQQIQEVNNDER